MPNVIVVPETEDFRIDVSHHSRVWINTALGVPQLEGRDARYVAPCWLGESPGVNRVYHVLSLAPIEEATELVLGNSFVVNPIWDQMGQHRRFEYHDLRAFNLAEIRPGLLLDLPTA